MSGYKKEINLNPSDVALIEDALRAQSSALSKSKSEQSAAKAREIQLLLGKLHDQKIFYSHASNQQAPLG
jgi:hypothetical protein